MSTIAWLLSSSRNGRSCTLLRTWPQAPTIIKCSDYAFYTEAFKCVAIKTERYSFTPPKNKATVFTYMKTLDEHAAITTPILLLLNQNCEIVCSLSF